MRRTRPQQHGFTLLELLCVVGCVVLLAGIAGGAIWHVVASLQVRSSATEFVQTVKTARQFAVDQRCRTRIAFRPGIYGGPATEKPEDDRTYRLFAFIVPSAAPGDRGRWVEVTGKLEGSGATGRAELARLELSPRPEGMVGRWIPCTLDPKVRRVPDSVKVVSPLFERFASSEPEEFFADNYHTPESVWTLRGADPHDPENSVSVFPGDYWESPIDQSPTLMTGPIPDWALCYDPITEDIVEASAFWPGTVQFFGGMKKCKTAQLPGIEFQPDGSLACVWTKEIEVRFASAQRAETGYSVVIDAITGLSRIVDEEVQ